MKSVLTIFILSLLLFIRAGYAEEIKESVPGGKGKVSEIKASEGTLKDGVQLEWKYSKNGMEYAVYRSTLAEGPYEEIGMSLTQGYKDSSAIPGVRYWYRLLILNDDSPLELSSAATGYRMQEPVKGLMLDTVLKKKTKKAPAITGKNEKELNGKFLDFLREFYTNNVKLSIIMAFGKNYIKRGDLILLSDFDEYKFNEPERMFYFIKKGNYIVSYYSKKFSKLIMESKALDPNHDRLSKRLFENMLVYCLDTGKKEIVTDDGVTMIIQTYEAAGVSTEYYRDNRDWEFSTIMIGSSNKKIKNMMRDAQKRGR